MNLLPVTRTGDIRTSVGLVDPRLHRRAVRIARRHVNAALGACSTSFSSEIVRTRRAGTGPVHISPLLAWIVSQSLEAARLTDGAFDPTVRPGGTTKVLVGCGGSAQPPRRAAGWCTVRVDAGMLVMPHETTLVLQPVALAMAAQSAAREIYARCGSGALVVAGASAAVAGETREWDIPGGLLPRGTARTWAGPEAVVDPGSGREVVPLWREVVVTSPSAPAAAALAIAASVWRTTAPERLAHLGVSARLTSLAGETTWVA
nr:FAD:protein FMN transferase [Motilibacter peucedani]